MYGVHGYDNNDEDMQAIFMAQGPLIRSGQVLKPFDNIDIYMLICTMLHIICPPSEGDNRRETWDKLLKSGVPRIHGKNDRKRYGRIIHQNRGRQNYVGRNNVGRTPYNRNVFYRN